MSAFAQKEGGMLTDEQINAIIRGIRERWSKPNALSGDVAPALCGEGDRAMPQSGQAVYEQLLCFMSWRRQTKADRRQAR